MRRVGPRRRGTLPGTNGGAGREDPGPRPLLVSEPARGSRMTCYRSRSAAPASAAWAAASRATGTRNGEHET